MATAMRMRSGILLLRLSYTLLRFHAQRRITILVLPPWFARNYAAAQPAPAEEIEGTTLGVSAVKLNFRISQRLAVVAEAWRLGRMVQRFSEVTTEGK